MNKHFASITPQSLLQDPSLSSFGPFLGISQDLLAILRTLQQLGEHQFRHVTRPEYVQTNLVSDGSVPAMHTDPNLINPWGVAYAPGGPFWVSDNGTGLTTIYDGSGAALSPAGHSTITIATPSGQTTPASPTGQVFNSAGAGFNITENGHTASSIFIFVTEDGTISGWNPAVDAGHSVLVVDNSNGGNNGAVYKGVTIGNDGEQTLLYAANFRNGTVDVFDQSFHQVKSFTDSSLPTGYAPFNVQNVNGRLFVTFALQNDVKHDDVPGRGHGFVDEFDMSGTLVARVASHGPLDSPWGLDTAPAGFGQFANDLLVGNFGGGTIDAYNPRTFAFQGQVLGTDGKPLHIGDLWALTNGHGGAGGDPNAVYFTAGVADEAHGLFGTLTASPTSHPMG